MSEIFISPVVHSTILIQMFFVFFPVYPILTPTSPRFRSFIILGRENHHPSHPSNYFTCFYTQFYVYVLTFIIICVLQFLNTDTSLSWTILLFHNWTDFIQFLPPYLDRSWRFFCLSQSQSLAVVNNDVRLPFLISVIVASVTVYSIILSEMKYM